MARRSRLSRNYVKKSQKTIVLSILAIAAVIFLVLRYGIPLISDAGFFVGQITKSQNEEQKKEEDNKYVPPPSLFPIDRATKTKELKISGTALSELKVELFLNGSKEDETVVDENGDFEFDIELSEGENIIKARAVDGKNESEFSDSMTITYKKTNPNLSIDSPHDGDSITGGNSITVSGKTDPDTNVLVNDFQAIVDSLGSYSYQLTLKGGDNEIKVAAIDLAGNKTEKIIHINYSQ